MSEPQSTAPETPPAPPPTGSWRDERRRERRDRRDARYHAWAGVPVGALILIGLGVFFLLRNLGYPVPDNWWALFFLIPAGGTLVAAARLYREAGQVVTGEVLAVLIPGIVFLLLFAAFFFNFAWGIFWPVILLAAGGAMLLRGWWPR